MNNINANLNNMNQINSQNFNINSNSQQNNMNNNLMKQIKYEYSKHEYTR